MDDKTAADLVREVTKAGPEAHDRALARGYGSGPEAGPGGCRAMANLAGMHIWCNEDAPHPALAHGNKEAGLIWLCGVEAAHLQEGVDRDREHEPGVWTEEHQRIYDDLQWLIIETVKPAPDEHYEFQLRGLVRTILRHRETGGQDA